jgi:hypothetical protein
LHASRRIRSARGPGPVERVGPLPAALEASSAIAAAPSWVSRSSISSSGFPWAREGDLDPGERGAPREPGRLDPALAGGLELEAPPSRPRSPRAARSSPRRRGRSVDRLRRSGGRAGRAPGPPAGARGALVGRPREEEAPNEELPFSPLRGPRADSPGPVPSRQARAADRIFAPPGRTEP